MYYINIDQFTENLIKNGSLKLAKNLLLVFQVRCCSNQLSVQASELLREPN